MQLAWWNWAYEYLLQADDQTEKGYRKIASVRASEFMQQPQLRAYKKWFSFFQCDLKHVNYHMCGLGLDDARIWVLKVSLDCWGRS